MKLTSDSGPAVAVATWLQSVSDRMEDGEPIDPDPFYPRNPLLTPDIVEKVVEEVEGVFEYEMRCVPSYHYAQHGMAAPLWGQPPVAPLVPPGFTTLPYPAKLALVQEIDRILQAYREEELA